MILCFHGMIVDDAEKIEEALLQATQYDDTILIEEFIEGKELTLLTLEVTVVQLIFPIIEITT